MQCVVFIDRLNIIHHLLRQTLNMSLAIVFLNNYVNKSGGERERERERERGEGRERER